MVLAYLAGRSGGGGGGDIIDDCVKTPELVSPTTVSRDGRSEVECHILRWRRKYPLSRLQLSCRALSVVSKSWRHDNDMKQNKKATDVAETALDDSVRTTRAKNEKWTEPLQWVKLIK